MTKSKISEEEITEFRDSVKNVKPLSQTQHISIGRINKTVKQNIKKDSKEIFFENISVPEITAEEIISFARTGLQYKILKQLKNGQLRIEAELDLHGLSSEQAANTLTNFINYCQKQKFRCVRIIHGKGRDNTSPPILKNKVNNWLRQIPAVLAFHSARPRDGGTGALYVLLKKI